MKTGLIISLLLCLCTCLPAREDHAYRPFSARMIDSLQQVEDLRYGREPQPDTEPDNMPDESFFSPQTLRWMIYGALALVLAAIVIALIRRFFEKEGQVIATGGVLSPGSLEELTRSNYLQQMNEAAAAGQWEHALRYSHLWVLQQLQQRGHIQWEAHKTDTDYWFELKDPALQQAFLRSAGMFARAWYAEQPVSETDYVSLHDVRRTLSGKKDLTISPATTQP